MTDIDEGLLPGNSAADGELNMWEVFGAVAAAVPDRTAIVWRDRRLTYREVFDRSARLGAVLASHGLGIERDRSLLEPWASGQDLVGAYLLNGPEYLEVTFGGYAARVAPFNVNYRYVADELAYLLNDAGAGALVYHARFAPTVADVLPRLTRVPLLLQVADSSANALLPGALDYEAELAGADITSLPAAHSPDDLYVLYTGGTTGMPKGTLWRQADIWVAALGGDLLAPGADVQAIAAGASAAPDEGGRFLVNAPLMHGAAHWLSLRSLLSGGTVVINSVVERLDPADAWRLVAAEHCTTMLMVGEAFARPLLDELEAGSYDCSSIVAVIVGGAVTSPETKSRMLSSMPQALIVDAAGASETGSSLSSVSAAGATAAAGIFKPGPTTVVLDADHQAVLRPGDRQDGWYAKSGRIPLGYLGDAAKTAATFPVVGGTRYSVPGDRARYLDDGTIELLGRDSVTINSAGEKIYAEEVERALLFHPAVRDVLVVGRPSERWGQEVVAVVSLVAEPGAGDGPADSELVAAAAEHIARYKLPKSIIRVPEVVRSPAGKADYRWAARIASGADPHR